MFKKKCPKKLRQYDNANKVRKDLLLFSEDEIECNTNNAFFSSNTFKKDEKDENFLNLKANLQSNPKNCLSSSMNNLLIFSNISNISNIQKVEIPQQMSDIGLFRKLNYLSNEAYLSDTHSAYNFNQGRLNNFNDNDKMDNTKIIAKSSSLIKVKSFTKLFTTYTDDEHNKLQSLSKLNKYEDDQDYRSNKTYIEFFSNLRLISNKIYNNHNNNLNKSKDGRDSCSDDYNVDNLTKTKQSKNAKKAKKASKAYQFDDLNKHSFKSENTHNSENLLEFINAEAYLGVQKTESHDLTKFITSEKSVIDSPNYNVDNITKNYD